MENFPKTDFKLCYQQNVGTVLVRYKVSKWSPGKRGWICTKSDSVSIPQQILYIVWGDGRGRHSPSLKGAITKLIYFRSFAKFVIKGVNETKLIITKE